MNVNVRSKCNHWSQILQHILCAGLVGVVTVTQGQEVPVNAVVQTKRYADNHFFFAKKGSELCGMTISDVLESDDFPFEPKPGQFKVIIGSATFDDLGSIGGIDAVKVAGDACWSHMSGGEEIPATSVRITGNRLQVDIQATDIAECCQEIGWLNVVVTWIAWDCDDCEGQQCAAGSTSYENNSVDVSIRLGKTRQGQSAGQLRIQAENPSPSLTTPSVLQVFAGASVQIITNNAAVRQVLAPEALADVVTYNAYRYEVRFYVPGTFVWDDSTGLYVPTGDAYSTLVVENPEPATTNKLQFIETAEGSVRTNLYEWMPAISGWALVADNGLRWDIRGKAWNGNTRLDTREIWNPDGQPVLREIQKYEVFPVSMRTNLVERVVNPDGEHPLVYRWYYTDTKYPDTNSWPRLMMMNRAQWVLGAVRIHKHRPADESDCPSG